MKAFIWTIVGLGVGAGIVLGANGVTQGTQPTYIIPATPPVTTSVVPAPVSQTWVPGPSEVQWPPTQEDPNGPPMDSDPTGTGVPCVRVNQEADGTCSGRGVIPYPPGDPRLGVPADPNPTPVPEAPFAPPDFGPHLV